MLHFKKSQNGQILRITGVRYYIEEYGNSIITVSKWDMVSSFNWDKKEKIAKLEKNIELIA